MPSAYDVNSGLPFDVTFQLIDIDTGISPRHLPMVYVQSLGDQIVTVTAQRIASTPTSSDYIAHITLPFGFGYSEQSLVISVFGAVNNHLTIGGWPNIKTMNRTTTDVPRLSSASPVSTEGGLITLYGTGFGTNATLITGKIQTSLQVYGKDNLGPAVFSSSVLLVYMVPASSEPYQIYVTVDGVVSNSLNINPIGPVIPTPTPSNGCPGSPVKLQES
eukprot:gene21682-26047_t